MQSRLVAASTVIVAALVLAGCGPSAEEEAAIAKANAEACAEAMVAFNRAQESLDDGISSDDITATKSHAGDLRHAAATATGDTKDVIEEAADALMQWAEEGMPLSDGAIPLYVDSPMYLLEANCGEDE